MVIDGTFNRQSGPSRLDRLVHEPVQLRSRSIDAPITSHRADPSGAAWTADMSTQEHQVNHTMGQAIQAAPVVSQSHESGMRLGYDMMCPHKPH